MPGTACSVTLHPQLQQNWRKLRLQKNAGVNAGCGQQTGKELNSRVGWQNQKDVFCCRLCACKLTKSGTDPSNVSLQERCEFIYTEGIQYPSISQKKKKKICQLILNWDLPLHLICLRIHHKESFLWGRLRNAPREKGTVVTLQLPKGIKAELLLMHVL